MFAVDEKKTQSKATFTILTGHKEARLAVMRLPDKIKEKDEKLKEEMLSTDFYRVSQQVSSMKSSNFDLRFC